MNKTTVGLLSLSILFFLIFLSYFIPAQSKTASANKITIKFRESLENPKTLCLTRFLINIPRGSQNAYGRLSVGAELTRIPDGAYEIEKLINSDIKENSRDARMFYSDKEFDKITGKILPSTEQKIKQVLGINGYEKCSVRTYFSLGQDAYISTSLGLPPSFVRNRLSEDIEAFKHLRPRTDDDIPLDSGICIDGAFSTLETPYESIEFGARLKRFPDVHFSMQTIKNGDGLMSVDLHGDLKESQQEARDAGLGTWANRLKILRQRKRVVNDWHGEEMLLRVPSGYGKPSNHKFMFRSAGAIQDPLHPFVEMTLDTGIKDNKTASVEPSLSDEEALALWDWLLNSIRVRPNAVAAKASAPAKPGA